MPSTNFSHCTRNRSNQYQCAGCKNIENMIRAKANRSDWGSNTKISSPVHDSFKQLDLCAKKRIGCQVIRRILLLDQVTVHEARCLLREDQMTVHASVLLTIVGRLIISIQDFKLVGLAYAENDPTAHFRLCLQPEHRMVVEQVKSWLVHCQEAHHQCLALKWSDSDNPTYLIHTIPRKPLRLVHLTDGRLVK